MKNYDKDQVEDELDEISSVAELMMLSNPADIMHVVTATSKIICEKVQKIKDVLSI